MKKLSDALFLIQSIEQAICDNKYDPAKVALLQDSIGNFKIRLSDDFSLPMEYFDPIDLNLQQKIFITEEIEASEEIDISEEIETPEEILFSESPELTEETEKLYWEINSNK